MKLPQLLLSMRPIHNISLPLEADISSSLVCPFRTRNLSELLHSRNLLLPRDMRVLTPQRVPILNVRGECLPGAAEHHNHPSHHLLPLLHTEEISFLSQQLAEGCWSSRGLCCVNRCVNLPPQGNDRAPPSGHPPSRVVLQASPNCTEPSGKVYRAIVYVRRCGANPWLSRQVVYHGHRG